jgi:arylsulfatase A-like enzyme
VVTPLRATVASNGMQQQRYFLWYAPRLPHDGSVAPNYFQALYGTPQQLDPGQEYLARTSWLDTALDALLDELARTCVCGEREDAQGNPTGEPAVESLYDNTVVIAVPDNAILLPEAKNSNKPPENAHRNALVVAPPGPRRQAPGPARVLDEQTQFSGHQDLLPTVLDYFGVPTPTRSRGTRSTGRSGRSCSRATRPDSYAAPSTATNPTTTIPRRTQPRRTSSRGRATSASARAVRVP